MRGEHSTVTALIASSTGSSPHARGARFQSRACRFPAGIIPACAGSTAAGQGREEPRWDHPRMRGEHAHGHLVGQPEAGIIPACAGSTYRTESLPALPMGSSPHARGAPQTLGRIPPNQGDHPRMRGEHWRGARPLSLVMRIIPACAGSTPTASELLMYPLDHPRMRGEHAALPDGLRTRLGIIPACAGSTVLASKSR